LVQSPLDDAFRSHVVVVGGGESKLEGIMFQVVTDAQRHEIVRHFLAQHQLELW
jgi:hypothetical protein